MNVSLNGLSRAAVVYLAVPVFVFFFGWLRPLPLVLLGAGLAWGLTHVWRAFAGSGNSEGWRADRWLCAAVGVVAALWVALSGIGEFAFQNFDHNARNAILHDLVERPWPVQYSGNHVLVYYFAFWLPAALVGKLLGWSAALVALFVWSVLGVWLVLMLVVASCERGSVLPALGFVFFSGADLLGRLYLGHGLPLLGEHFEWWAELFQYSSHTTTLFWVFNQAIPAWLATLLVWRTPGLKPLGFLAALIVPYAPLAAVGLLAVVGYRVVSEFVRRPKFCWRDLLSAANWCGAAMVGVYVLFYGMNHGCVTSWLLDADMAVWPVVLMRYTVFLVFEIGLLTLVFWREIGRDPFVRLALVSLVLIPLVVSDAYNDFCTRASLPALLILSVAVVRAWTGPWRSGPAANMRRTLQLALVVVCAVTPFNELWRGATGTRHGADNVRTLEYEAMQSYGLGWAWRNYVADLPGPEVVSWRIFRYSESGPAKNPDEGKSAGAAR